MLILSKAHDWKEQVMIFHDLPTPFCFGGEMDAIAFRTESK